MVVVETVNLLVADEPGYALLARSVWAGLRVLGLLVLLRLVRLGRTGARPLGLILAVTTVFAVARLAQPRTGSLVPQPVVVVGLLVLAGMCTVMVWWLYRAPPVAAHLSQRPPRRQVPPWALTARLAALTYPALLAVPLFVAVGDFFTDAPTPVPGPVALFVLTWWMGLFLALAAVLPVVSLFVVAGKSWARWLLRLAGWVVAFVGPLFCFVLSGLDGLLRDGIPIVVTAVLGLYALHRSRASWPTWRHGAPTEH